MSEPCQHLEIDAAGQPVCGIHGTQLEDGAADEVCRVQPEICWTWLSERDRQKNA